MEKLLEINDICLIASETNLGYRKSEYNFGVLDDIDKCTSLPIFTSPMNCIVDKTNLKVFEDKGIRTVLPRSEELGIRLEGSQYVFCSFSLDEVVKNFLTNRRNSSTGMFRVCIETGNGGDIEVLNAAVDLKKIYGPSINIMTGNIWQPKTYIDYCKAGIDYARVGCGTGSVVDESLFGFYYPLASLLIDINGTKNTACSGLKKTKIIADGGIFNPVEILKCIALGADYVMCGRIFARLIESVGMMCIKSDKTKQYEQVTREEAIGRIKELGPKEADVKRLYQGINADYLENMISAHDLLVKDFRSEWIKVNGTLDEWLKEMYTVFSYAFTMTGSINWKEYKNNVRYGRVQ